MVTLVGRIVAAFCSTESALDCCCGNKDSSLSICGTRPITIANDDADNIGGDISIGDGIIQGPLGTRNRVAIREERPVLICRALV